LRRVILTVALLTLTAALLPMPAVSGGATGTPTFRMSSTGGTGVELNVGVAANGHVFVGAWDGVRKSTDDGVTWTAIPDNPVLTFAADRVLVVDKATGRVFLDDTSLACTILAWTDDEGATWLHNPVACGGSATDHQKVAVGPRVGAFADPTGLQYKNVVYVCANGLSHDSCAISLDGGLTFVPGPPHGVGCAFQGVPVTDSAGVLYEPSVACGANLRVSTDNGLTWVQRVVPASAAANSGTLADVATTPDGTVYFLYADSAYHAKYVWSKNQGASWSAPVDVTPAGVTSVGFPVIVAGDDGRVGIAMYGTTDSAMTGHNPGDAGTNVAWHGFVAIVTGADTAAPAIQSAQVTPAGDPLHIGCISKDGACGVSSPLADYFDIDVGPDGRVYAVFGDACLPGCTSHAQSTTSHAVVAVQTGGTNLKA
jgi:hypothetical protein